MEQMRLHPSFQMMDAVKLCYQAAFGAEHLLGDREGAYRYFMTEWEELDLAAEENEPLFEMISENYSRVNMRVWKKSNYPPQRLFDMFASTADEMTEAYASKEKTFGQCLELIGACLKERTESGEKCNFTYDEWNKYYTDYLVAGIRPVHHSEMYRLREIPSYRIVSNIILAEEGDSL